ncbi:hypothetical protein [Odoribacter lunatus]|uniref:hypothetical protein n=1 Tax=Odoribacter lunatus TaxID=2941335 RepID=UPI00203D4C46|nr:hypothetical protein [Odoribacter lunatus]
MTFLKKASWSIVLSALLCLFSCGDSDLLKFDNVGVKNWEPDYTLQLAFANYTVWKLIEQTDKENSPLINENDTIFIRYEEDIFHLEKGNVIELPQAIVSFYKSIPVGGVSEDLVGASSTTPLDLELLPLVRTINFKKGELIKLWGSVDVEYKLSRDIDYDTLEVMFTNILDSNSLQPICVKFTPQDASPKLERLKNVVFDMEEHPNQLQCEIRVKGLVAQAGSSSELIVSIDIKNMECSQIKAKINPLEIPIPAGTFDMGIEFWDNFNGSFKFANPKVDLIVKHYGVVVPMQADMNFVAYGDNKSVALKPKSGYKLTFEGKQEEIQGYNTSNSNIDTLLSLPPKDSISYSGEVIVFYDSNVVVLSKGDINADVKVKVEIPLNLSIKDVIFNDTIDDINIADADKIKSAKIKVRAENNIPLGLGAGCLYFLNETKTPIDSVVVEHFLDAPELEGGRVILPKEGENDIELSNENILNLKRTKYIVISVKAETSGNGETSIVIDPGAELKLGLILEAKLDMDKIF